MITTTLTLNKVFSNLDNLMPTLNKNSKFSCTKEYDIWNYVRNQKGQFGNRLDENGQIAKCLVLKKNNMNAVSIYFTNSSTICVSHIIPHKTLNAYFGKNTEQRQNIIEILTSRVKEVLLKSSQQRSFSEMEKFIMSEAI